jgi:hypothetical protein
MSIKAIPFSQSLRFFPPDLTNDIFPSPVSFGYSPILVGREDVDIYRITSGFSLQVPQFFQIFSMKPAKIR